MHIIRIKVSGFRKLEDGFTIDFIAKRLGQKPEYNGELIMLGDYLYTPASPMFIGRNGSGKTSVLTLIYYCHLLLKDGKMPYCTHDFRKDHIDLEIYFIDRQRLYCFTCQIVPPKVSNFFSEPCCELLEQRLTYRHVTRYNPNSFWTAVHPLHHKIRPIPTDRCIVSYFNLESFSLFGIFISNKYEMLKETLRLMVALPENARLKIFSLFRLDFLNIIPQGDGTCQVILPNHQELIIQSTTLTDSLSHGTLRGMLLYTSALLALKDGGVLVVDEIEMAIHSSLVVHLLGLFLSKDLNRHGAKIFFSTFKESILDIFHRYDHINVVYVETNKLIQTRPLNAFFDDRIRTQRAKLFAVEDCFLKPDAIKMNEIRKLIKDEIR